MAEYQGQHGHANPRVDEYGNPVGQGTAGYGATGTGTHGMGPGAGYGATGTGAHGATGYPHGGAAATTGVGGQFQPVREEHKTGGILHRSGSSSSSSSEDDGEGGRRKGIKEKIKEKVPGTPEHQERKATETTSTGYGQGHMGNKAAGTTGTHMGESGEKKGIMDKIKEKLPGHQ